MTKQPLPRTIRSLQLVVSTSGPLTPPSHAWPREQELLAAGKLPGLNTHGDSLSVRRRPATEGRTFCVTSRHCPVCAFVRDPLPGAPRQAEHYLEDNQDYGLRMLAVARHPLSNNKITVCKSTMSPRPHATPAQVRGKRTTYAANPFFFTRLLSDLNPGWLSGTTGLARR